MKPIQYRPVHAFPGATLLMQRQPKQPQNRVADLVLVNLHGHQSITSENPKRRGSRQILTIVRTKSKVQGETGWNKNEPIDHHLGLSGNTS